MVAGEPKSFSGYLKIWLKHEVNNIIYKYPMRNLKQDTHQYPALSFFLQPILIITQEDVSLLLLGMQQLTALSITMSEPCYNLWFQ